MDNLNKFDELELDDSVKGSISEMAKWTKFLSITAFIVMGLFLLIFILFAGSISTIARAIPGAEGLSDLLELGGGFIIAIILVIAAVTFTVYYFIFNFSRKAKIALQTEDAPTLTQAFTSLKTYFVISAVLAIIGIVFTLMSFLN
jgi:hypothetical protein